MTFNMGVLVGSRDEDTEYGDGRLLEQESTGMAKLCIISQFLSKKLRTQNLSDSLCAKGNKTEEFATAS